MANTSDIKNGLIINHKNGLYKIVEFLHVKPGKGGAFVRTKIKNVRTGQVIDETFRGGANIDVVRIEARKFNYLFSDGIDYIFMDNETYDQISLTKDNISEVKDFLIENLEATIAFNGNEPIEIRIPPHVNMEVTETDPGEKGNTAQGGTKPAILETGVSVQVPLFIQIGDKIRVNTRDKKYIERVKL